MKRLAAFLLFALLLPFAAMADDPAPWADKWNKSTEFYSRKTATSLTSEIFGNSYTGQVIPAQCSTPGQWCLIEFPETLIDNDAKAVFLAGILILTRGSTDETADLTIAFRTPGDTSKTCGHYVGQAVISLFTGERTNFAAWMPVVNRKLEFCWQRSTGGNWPTNTSYGFNLALQAWVK